MLSHVIFFPPLFITFCCCHFLPLLRSLHWISGHFLQIIIITIVKNNHKISERQQLYILVAGILITISSFSGMDCTAHPFRCSCQIRRAFLLSLLVLLLFIPLQIHGGKLMKDDEKVIHRIIKQVNEMLLFLHGFLVFLFITPIMIWCRKSRRWCCWVEHWWDRGHRAVRWDAADAEAIVKQFRCPQLQVQLMISL